MKALSLVLLCLVFSHAFASDVGYEVEVILFEGTTGVYDHVEKWSVIQDSIASANDAEQAKQTIPQNKKTENTAAQIQLLKPEQFRLKSQANRLSKHPDYRILIHTAWKQTGLDKDKAFAVHVDSTQNLTAKDKPAQETGSVSTNQDSRIVGDITLVMSRYLHINTDLLYQKRKPQHVLSYDDQGTAATEAQLYDSYPVIFERRMRSREIHYLDHPLVGMIVLATPYKIGVETEKSKPVKTYKTL